MGSGLHCANCGHDSSYHSVPICGFDHGASRAERCQCAVFAPLEFKQLQARLVEVTAERDTYMQAMLNLIHDLSKQAMDRNPAGSVEDGETR